jgi:hypothetical protein
VDTASALDFDSHGVAAGDTLRLTGGPAAGDYSVRQVLAPLFTRVRVDRPLPASLSNVAFAVFRSNPGGGIVTPLVRVRGIELLDASGQPTGARVPYARPVDARSRAFANTGHGVEQEVTDARLGLVSLPFPAGANVSGLTLDVAWGAAAAFSVTFAAPNPIAVGTLVQEINAACLLATGIARVAVAVDASRLGLVPVGSGMRVLAGAAAALLFGGAAFADEIQSDAINAAGGWSRVDPVLDVAQVLDGAQIGVYGPLAVAASGALRVGRDLLPEIGRHVQAGARSLGSARLYFLDPTSVEVDGDARFLVTAADGGTLAFVPDPTASAVRIPAPPDMPTPRDGRTVPGGRSLFSSIDFVAKGVQRRERLEISVVPIAGSAALSDPVPNLHGARLVLSLGGGADKAITFLHDTSAIPASDVSRAAVIEQINRVVGQKIASLSSANELELETDLPLIVRAAGTANALLGLPTQNDVSNASPHAGTYAIADALPGELRLDRALPNAGANPTLRQHFRVVRPGVQRISATAMARQLGPEGLYHADVELVSVGTGDIFNIEAELPMEVRGYRADGYWLTTEDPNLSFSPAERPVLHLSRSILDVGVSDDPENASPLSGQNLDVQYERSALTSHVQGFLSAETERVVNASPLARHLLPHFVRFDLRYAGGSRETEVLADLERYIRALAPADALEVSAIEKIVLDRGASSIDNPIELLAIVHGIDRTVTMARSKNRLLTGRLAAFIPDAIRIVRR